MSCYVNGVNISSDDNAVRIVTENETTKYYPRFRNMPDPNKVDPTDHIIYDGGTISSDVIDDSTQLISYDGGTISSNATNGNIQSISYDGGSVD